MTRCDISWLIGTLVGGAMAYGFGHWAAGREKSK